MLRESFWAQLSTGCSHLHSSNRSSACILGQRACVVCYNGGALSPLPSRGILMRQKSKFASILLLVALVVYPQFAPLLLAQAAIPTAAELDQLLAPVALYPDSLLSQITTASTNPQEILDVDNWLAQNSGLTAVALTDAAQQQGFDPAFIALVNFPGVLDMMAQNIDDYAAIGAAFSADQGAVSASIQRLRDQAYRAGTLQTTAQQQVVVQQAPGQTIYVIQPVNPQIVYVPQYDPTVVYVGGGPSLVTFGIGIGIGALLVDHPWGWGGWGWNWGARRAYYNHGYWGGWANPYRPPRPWYRPRPIVWANRPGYGGNWHYRPRGYQPPRPGNRPGPNRPPWGPGNRPGRPSIQPVKPGPNRPTPSKPGPNRPGPNKPGPNNPSKPSNPRPTPPNRPKPQPEKPGATNPSRPGRPTTPGETKPTPKPEKPPANPGRPGAQPGSDRPGTNRPETNRPAPTRSTKPDKAKQDRSAPGPAKPSQPSARPAKEGKPAPQSKPAPKPRSEEKPQARK
jgi:uncharacterized protein DUF3300